MQGLPASSNLLSGQQSNHTNNVRIRKSVLSAQKVGKGLIAVMSSSTLFTDREMGSGSVQPPPNMQKIYELEFWIFSELLQLEKRKPGN
jgi:hypothetical protein